MKKHRLTEQSDDYGGQQASRKSERLLGKTSKYGNQEPREGHSTQYAHFLQKIGPTTIHKSHLPRSHRRAVKLDITSNPGSEERMGLHRRYGSTQLNHALE